MAVRSQFNNRLIPLIGLGSFTGQAELTKLGNALSVAVYADTLTTLTIEQSPNTTNWYIFSQYPIQPNSQEVIQIQTTLEYFRVTIHNESIYPQTYCNMVTSLVQIMTLDALKDSVLMVATDLATGLQHPVNCDASGNLIVSGGGGGDASLWANYPAVANVDMDFNGLLNVNGISGLATKGLGMSADGILNLTSNNSGVVLSSKTEIALAIQPESSPTPPPTKTLTYDVDGDLTFAEGTQNITNELGTTTSKEFTLTQGGGGVITFEDGTTMSTAGGGGGGGNFSTPSDVTLDMSGNKIINITQLGGVGAHYNPIIVNNDITFAGNPEFGSASQMTNLEYLYGNVDNGLTITNVATVSTGSLATDLLIISPTVILSGDLKFNNDATIQTTAYQNPFVTSLSLDGNSIIGTQEIFGNSDITVTAGLTDTTESSTLSLTNNGYEIAGTYSKLFLKPTGVELNTGDITAETDFKAILDQTGVFTAPKFKVAEEIIGGGLDMNKSVIINVSNINSAAETNINISGIDADSQVVINANTSGVGGTSSLSVAPAGIFLNALITGTEDTATAFFSAQSGTFIAPFFEAQGFQPTGAPFQKGSINVPLVQGVETIFFSDLTSQSTAYTGDDVKTITSTDGSVVITEPSPNTVNLSVAIPPSITSNTFYVNDNVNTINDVIGLMGAGDICIVSAGSFGNTTDINWNVAQTGLSGSVAPLPLTFLTTANASRFTVTAVQVRIANIKFQMPVFLSNNNLTVDNCDFDDNLTVGTGVSGYITINNCEFVGTKTITVASSFANVCYFINCNFLSSTFVLSQASASQIIFNNCAGFTTYPANATYVGINTLSAGTAQLSTNDIKSVSGTLRLTSGLNVNSQAFTNVGTMSPPTSQQISFTNGLNIPSGSLNMRFNNIFNAGTITWTTGLTTIASASATRNLYSVSIPAFVSGANADFVMNDLGVFSTKSVTLTTGGVITYPDATTSNSGLIKGSGTLVAGSYTIADTRVTAGCIVTATYAHAPSIRECLGATVTAGVGIVINSSLAIDTSPIFYMYFI